MTSLGGGVTHTDSPYETLISPDDFLDPATWGSYIQTIPGRGGLRIVGSELEYSFAGGSYSNLNGEDITIKKMEMVTWDPSLVFRWSYEQKVSAQNLGAGVSLGRPVTYVNYAQYLQNYLYLKGGSGGWILMKNYYTVFDPVYYWQGSVISAGQWVKFDWVVTPGQITLHVDGVLIAVSLAGASDTVGLLASSTGTIGNIRWRNMEIVGLRDIAGVGGFEP